MLSEATFIESNHRAQCSQQTLGRLLTEQPIHAKKKVGFKNKLDQTEHLLWRSWSERVQKFRFDILGLQTPLFVVISNSGKQTFQNLLSVLRPGAIWKHLLRCGIGSKKLRTESIKTDENSVAVRWFGSCHLFLSAMHVELAARNCCCEMVSKTAVAVQTMHHCKNAFNRCWALASSLMCSTVICSLLSITLVCTFISFRRSVLWNWRTRPCHRKDDGVRR